LAEQLRIVARLERLFYCMRLLGARMEARILSSVSLSVAVVTSPFNRGLERPRNESVTVRI
jgi:hypothetical protein